jgi:hypothetical protein
MPTNFYILIISAVAFSILVTNYYGLDDARLIEKPMYLGGFMIQ